MSDQTSSHPGLGEPTDISATDLAGEAGDPAPPASSDADQMRDEGLGTGDGADPQPGGAG